MAEHCPECGAEWRAGESCETDFHQMLAWENEYPGLGEVHHLTVLVYYLQHPSLYSPEGLAGARETLEGFVGQGLTPSAWRQRSQMKVNSNNRTWKITARPGAHGRYDHPMLWTRRAPDVVAGGPEHYADNVRAWAVETWKVLRSDR